MTEQDKDDLVKEEHPKIYIVNGIVGVFAGKGGKPLTQQDKDFIAKAVAKAITGKRR